jgi:hypothetical protein
MFSRNINYLTVRSIEHAWGIRFTKEEIERLLKKLNDDDIKNARDPQPPHSKI